MGKLLKAHQECPKCGSSDAAARYDVESGPDGFCFSCSQAFNWDVDEEEEVVIEAVPVRMGQMSEINALPSQAIPDRLISQATTAKYGVKENGNRRYYPTYRSGEHIGYRCRTLPKSFKGGHVGDVGGVLEFFGQHCWSNGGRGDRLCIVTVGEEDAMAAHQMSRQHAKNGRGYCAVSSPSGCAVLIKTVKAQLEWLEGFEKVVFAVDQEQVDLEKAAEAAELLSPGKAAIASFSENDASDMLKAGKSKEFYHAIWGAKVYSPAGIVPSADTWQMLEEFSLNSVFQLPKVWGLNEILPIIRPDDLVLIAAGTGVGKSTMLKELEYHLHKTTDYNIGVVHLEESLENTVMGLVGMELGVKLDVLNKDSVDPEDMKKAWETMFKGNRFYFEQAFGAINEMGIVNKIRYLVKGCDCKVLVIDHLHALASEFGDDENKHLHQLVYRLKSLTQELGCTIILAVHVRKRQDGVKGYEDGAVPTLDSIKGSSSIKQVADAAISISRGNIGEDSITQYHCVKNRHYGKLGQGNKLTYNHTTGRIELYAEQEGIM
jgi:twinkle protein